MEGDGFGVERLYWSVRPDKPRNSEIGSSHGAAKRKGRAPDEVHGPGWFWIVSRRARCGSQSLDEQHLLVRRQRPQVVGDEGFELVAGRADGVHRGDDHVASVLGVVERVALGG